MSVIRVEKSKNYTIMSNIHLRDKGLSLKAKGLLSVVLSLPDDWEYSLQGLSGICKENITAIRSAICELQKNGYAKVEKLYPDKSVGRKQIEYSYTFFESKQDIDCQDIENLHVDNLHVENHTQINTNKLNTDNEYTDKSNTDISYAFNSSEKKKELKEDTYASFPEEKEVRTPSRIKRISINKNDYTQSELKLYLRQTYEIICPKIDGYATELSKSLLETTLLFYSKYYKEMGVLHPILSDQAYQNIAYNYFNPPEQLSEYDTEDYAGEHEDLINLYFKTQYGKNSGHECDYKISHFMSEKVRNHLEMRLNGKMV